jgi:hypothetical protein
MRFAGGTMNTIWKAPDPLFESGNKGIIESTPKTRSFFFERLIKEDLGNWNRFAPEVVELGGDERKTIGAVRKPAPVVFALLKSPITSVIAQRWLLPHLHRVNHFAVTSAFPEIRATSPDNPVTDARGFDDVFATPVSAKLAVG